MSERRLNVGLTVNDWPALIADAVAGALIAVVLTVLLFQGSTSPGLVVAALVGALLGAAIPKSRLIATAVCGGLGGVIGLIVGPGCDGAPLESTVALGTISVGVFALFPRLAVVALSALTGLVTADFVYDIRSRMGAIIGMSLALVWLYARGSLPLPVVTNVIRWWARRIRDG